MCSRGSSDPMECVCKLYVRISFSSLMFSVVALRVSLIFLENQMKQWEHRGKETFLGDIMYCKKHSIQIIENLLFYKSSGSRAHSARNIDES